MEVQLVFGKQKNLVKYLLCCSRLEEDTFHLCQRLAKKISPPDLRSFVVSIGYDCLKHSKAVSELFLFVEKPNSNPQDCPKEMAKFSNHILELFQQLDDARIVSDDELVEVCKALVDLEDNLAELYSGALRLQVAKVLVEEVGALTPAVDANNFSKIFEDIIVDKERYRELLIDLGYVIAKKGEALLNNTPVVRYSNPDRWTAM